MQDQFAASKTGTADFDRDPNGLQMTDLSKQPETGKEKRFLLAELKQIKEQLYQKLHVFKSRSAGTRAPTTVSVDTTMFDILEHFSIEDILRKEIDHVFTIRRLLDTVVLRGDETLRTMQELAKLTND